jgi:hypothetical protein
MRFSSGLSGREIDWRQHQEDIKKDWHWYIDMDPPRPWYSLIDSWRSNAPYRKASGREVSVRIVKNVMLGTTMVLVVLCALLVFALCFIAEGIWKLLRNLARFLASK